MTIRLSRAAVMKLALYAAAIAVLLCAGFSPIQAEPLQKGAKVPSFTLKALNGEAFDSDRLIGKVGLIGFFSVNKTGFEDYLDLLQQYRRIYADQGLKVAAVNVDSTEKEALAGLEGLDLDFSPLMDTGLTASAQMNVLETPTTFLTSPEGEVALAIVGFDQGNRKTLSDPLDKALVQEGMDLAKAGSGKTILEEQFRRRALVANQNLDAGFSPDNTKIFYVTPDKQLWVFDLRARSRQQLADRASGAAWSPDGSRIAYGCKDEPGIYIRRMDTGATQKLTIDGYSPKWSPSGQFLAYRVLENEVWVYDFRVAKEWRVSVGARDIEWAPSADLILATDSRNRMWIVSPLAKYSLLNPLK